MADKELSAEDLRDKLFHTFRSRGVIDSMKSQLRNRLVLELQQSAKINLTSSRGKPTEQTSLLHQAANSLVANHLERCNLEYTLSVFLPESGTSKDKVLSVKDILRLLKIDPESLFYKSLYSSLSSKTNSKSFLLEFICQLSKLSPHSRQTVSIQTEDQSFSFKSSIDEKLRSVDKAFSERAEKENEAWSCQSEQKIIAFQRQCEERKKAELNAEIERYKTTELARMRLEERERYQKEIRTTRDQLEKDYSLKAEVLRVKEKETMERLHREQQAQEEKAYTQRQKILEEMQTIKERENESKRHKELDMKSVQLEEERIKAEGERIKHLQQSLKDQESHHQQKVDDEVQRFKLKFQEELQKRKHELELREAQFRQDKESFDKSKSTYMGYYDQLEGKKEELRHLQSLLERERYAAASLTQQKEMFAQQLNEFKDYRVIKEREQALQIKAASLQRDVEELTGKDKASKKTIKELNDKLSKPSPEMIALRGEVKGLKDDAKSKEKLHKERQKKLEAMLQAESQRCVEYQRLCEGHILRQKDMERELDDLQAALHHTQTVLRMELERRRMSDTSISDMQDVPTPSTFPVPPTPAMAHTQSRGHQELDDDVMNGTPPPNTADMITQSRDVYDKLEKEARELEESFRRFQSRMKNTGQFTTVPPVSTTDIPRYPFTQATGLPPSITMRTNNNKTDTQHNFVPLSWVPSTEHGAYKSSYMPSQPTSYLQTQPASYLQNTRPLTREGNGDQGTRFYTLPSFGVSHVTQNTSDDRYSSIPRDTRRPNNTVNVSDLIAKPGSPSIISAPIDHSPHDNTSKDTLKTNRVTTKHVDTSSDTSRRPLSSTIDREREGSGAGSRGTEVMTSVSAQRASGQNAFVPSSQAGVIFEGDGAEGELDDSDSRKSSEVSLSGGALSVGTLNKPAASKAGSRTRGRITEEQEPNESAANASNQTNRESMDSVWGKSKDESVFLKSQTALQDESANQRSQISLDSTWGKDKSDSVFLKSQTAIHNVTEPGENATQDSFDNAWAKQTDDGVSHRERLQSPDEETRGPHPKTLLDSNWRKVGSDSVFNRDQSGEESSASFKSDPSLPGMGGVGGLTVSLDNTWRNSAPKDNDPEKREREMRERKEREREERDWEEEKRRRENQKRQREEEALERQQRELRELQREEEERNAREARKQDEQEQQDKPVQQETEPEVEDPPLDPVMLQYMQMIQTRKEQEDKAKDEARVTKKSSKEALNTPSNSELSQDENLGSIEELSGDDGFDWG